MSNLPVVVPVLVAVVSGFFGWLTIVQKNRGDRGNIQAQGWGMLTGAQVSIIERLQSQIDRLQERVDRLEKERETARDLYWAAIGHAREIHRDYPQVRHTHPPPDEIANDINI